MTVDALLPVPRGCVDEKDYKAARWSLRRAAYLAAARAALAAVQSGPLAGASLTWADVDGDARRPALVVAPRGRRGAPPPPRLRLLPAPPAALAAAWMPRLAPDRRALAVGEGGGDGATPSYNAAVLADFCLAAPTAWARAAIAACPAVADALALATAWASAARLGAAPDPGAGAGFALLAALAAAGAAGGRLPASMTPLQAARGLLVEVGELGGGAEARALAAVAGGANGLPPPPPLSSWAGLDPPALIAADGWTNLTATATAGGLARAAAAAAAAVAALDAARAPGGDAAATVDALFLAPRPRWLPDYDAFWRVDGVGGADAPLAGDAPAARAAETALAALATRALGARARLVRALPRTVVTDAEAGPAVAPACGRTVLLAALADATALRTALDIGPRADDAAAAAAFRAFWGDAAELRRFEDGAIHEACVWPAAPGGGPAGVAAADAALAAALARHAPGMSVIGLTGALHGALADPGVDEAAAARAPAALAAATTLLSKALRGLPRGATALRPLAIMPLSPETRRAAPFAALPHPLLGGAAPPPPGRGVPRVAPAIEVAVQLEGTGRWPDDAAAAAKVRAALGTQLAGALTDAYRWPAAASEAGVDVCIDGYAFRLRLWTARDVDGAARDAARRAAAARAGAPPPPASPGAAAAHDAMTALQARIAHATLLAPLAGAAPGFGDGARLLARWAGAHLAGGLVAAPAWELLAAAAAGPRLAGGAGGGLAPPAGAEAGDGGAAPATGLAVFAAALRLLSHHPWPERPLVIDPDGSFEAKGRAAALRRAPEARGTRLALATRADAAGAAWTAACPPAAAARLAALAGAALNRLDGWLEAGGREGGIVETIFAPSLGGWDALLWLRPAALPGGGSRAPPGSAPPPLGRRGRGRPPGRCSAAVAEIAGAALAARGATKAAAEVLAGFDPVAHYASLLRIRYGAIAIVGHDAAGGGRAVGVRWAVAARARAAPGGLPGPTAPHPSPPAAVEYVTLDDEAALAEMAGLGAGLVDGFSILRPLHAPEAPQAGKRAGAKAAPARAPKKARA